MSVISMKQLLEAGVHFGHQTRRWNPKMAPYIYTERNGIYIIDLQQSVGMVDDAYNAVADIVANGGHILFVGTKKQAQDAIRTEAERCGEKKLYGHHAHNLMKTDIKEKKDGYELEMDLPGFKKDEITAELKDGYMTISAAKGLDQDEQEKDTGRYLRRERYAGACQRTFYVGEDVTEEDIKAEFKHGILKLFIPKKEAKPAEPEKKFISIEG